MIQANRNLWVVTDGAAGNELQALALARGLGSKPARVLRVRPRMPWNWLAPQWAPVLSAADWLPAPLSPPWPDLAIGAGRFGAAALLSVAKASGGTTRTLHILDPRIDPARFDCVIAPAHDELGGANVIAIDGSLHAIDDAWLERERQADPAFGTLASPRLVVLIGGPRRGVGLGADVFERLAETVRRHREAHGGSLIVIGSRRTPTAWADRVRARLGDAERLWFTPADGDNPYRAALAWGDVFVVTADSVNMQSEALGTGKPVYALSEGVPAGKLGRFQTAMVEWGRLRVFDSRIESWSYAPLRELGRILSQVQASI